MRATRILTALGALWTLGCGEISVAPPSETPDPQEDCESDGDCTSEASCREGFCDQGTCQYTIVSGACYVGGQCYEAGATQFQDKCQVCNPDNRISGFTQVGCGAGQVCDPSTGSCVAELDDVVQPDIEQPDVPMIDDGTDPPDEIDPPDEGPGDTADTDDGDTPVPDCESNTDCQDLETGPCEAAVCVMATGECALVTLPEGSACSPGTGGSAACFTGSCTVDGECDAQPVSNKPCDDGNACTLGDTCLEGVCTGSLKGCSDDNPCTLDSCEQLTGACTSTAVDDAALVACDDDSGCTEGDLCVGGECSPGVNTCDCATDADCEDDGNLCNGTYVCVDSKCVIDEATKISCDKSGDDACNVTSCVPATGQCETKIQVGGLCDDGNACTFTDKCKAAGQCGGTALNCDDQDVCTTDQCVAGQCQNTPNTSACNDGDACTEGDVCAGGVCAGAPLDCDDGQACTTDGCQAGNCVNTVLDSGACDDGNHCTTGDACQAGQCKGTALQCDDGNPCTQNGCNPGLAPQDYDPSDPLSACVYPPNTASCSDGNVCTTGDQCVSGTCEGGAAASCTTNEPCKVASCDSAQGCVISNAAPGTSCDDGNDCTEDEACNAAGVCGGGTSICDCTDDTECDNGDPCDGEEKCVSNSCVQGTKVECSPSNDPCNKNVCNPDTGQCGLVAANDGNVCGQDDVCFQDKVCDGGTCKGTAIPCPEKPCQVIEGCTPASGCKYTAAPAGAACDDGDACTKSDKCVEGTCKGASTTCNDNNPCTVDGCSPATGCTTSDAQNGAVCNVDGNFCTLDQCQGGTCQYVSDKACDDGIPCTIDSCSSANGQCTFIGDDTACDDENPCTQDICTANGCINEAMGDFAVCDDENKETAPDLCFQGKCAGAYVADTLPAKSNCESSELSTVALATIGNEFYAVGNFVQATDILSCKNNAEKVGVYKVSPGGLDPIGGTLGAAAGAAHMVIVGRENLLGVITGDGVDWEAEGLRAALEELGQLDYSAVAYALEQTSSSTLHHWAIAGIDQDLQAAGARCTTKSKWVCEPFGLEQGKTFPVDISLAAAGKCTFGCAPTSWLGGQSPGKLTFLFDGEGQGQYEPVSSIETDNQYFGVVQINDETAVHFGEELLFHCGGGECKKVEIPGYGGITITAGASYGDGLVLLQGSQGESVLHFLPHGAEWESEEWQHVPFTTDGSVPTEIAVLTTSGVVVMAADKESGRWVTWSFTK